MLGATRIAKERSGSTWSIFRLCYKFSKPRLELILRTHSQHLEFMAMVSDNAEICIVTEKSIEV